MTGNIKLAGFEIHKIDRKEMMIGLALIALSFLMPVLFTVQNFQVREYMHLALEKQENTDLMVAALRLVMLNALRAAPHYIGAYYIAESVELYRRGKKSWIPNACMILLILPLVYEGIGLVHGIRYDFGLPALLLGSSVVLFRRLDYQYISLTKKNLMLLIFTIAFQFLDIMPLMSGLPVGRGETSSDIKLFADVLEANSLLNAIGAVGNFSCDPCLQRLFSCSCGMQNNLLRLSEEKAKNADRAALLEMKNRTYREMKYLVHDLKSPLTSTQTLVGILKMQCEVDGRNREIEYLSRIESQMDRMSSMISEILYETDAVPATPSTF